MTPYSLVGRDKHKLRKMAQAVTLLICIKEKEGSKPGSDTD
jgi:hypothetical protein